MPKKVRSTSFLTWLGADPVEPTEDHASENYRAGFNQRAWLIPAAVGIAFLILSFVGWLLNPAQFYMSYLVGWTFCVTIALGALFFIVIQHLTKARWSVVVRRIPESLAWSFPLLAVLGLPLVFGMYDLYHWTHEELFIEGHPEYDAIVAGKEPYLNEPFFFARIAIYFIAWSTIAYKLYTVSVKHDVTPRRETPADLRFHSAWALPVLAITTAFASFDILMSLEPHWYSTIFGVYIFAGAFVSVLAAITLASILLQRVGGKLKQTITVEHYHDLGKLLFGFTVFWAYIYFSQYMLIWYAGIPETTMFYRFRLEYGWQYLTYSLVVMHFVVPFLVLLPRFTKRAIPVLAFISVWILVMHWFDLYWLTAPTLMPENAGFHWLDLTSVLGVGGIVLATFMYRMSRHALVPARDPWLSESINFENV